MERTMYYRALTSDKLVSIFDVLAEDLFNCVDDTVNVVFVAFKVSLHQKKRSFTDDNLVIIRALLHDFDSQRRP